MKQLLKIARACEELKVSRQTLYNWKKKGVITFIKAPSGSVFIEDDEAYKK